MLRQAEVMELPELSGAGLAFWKAEEIMGQNIEPRTLLCRAVGKFLKWNLHAKTRVVPWVSSDTVALGKAARVFGWSMVFRAWSIDWGCWVFFKGHWQAEGRVLPGLHSSRFVFWKAARVVGPNMVHRA